MSQKARTQETRLDCSLLVRSLPVDCHSPCVHYRPGDDSAAVAAYARFRSLREPLLLQRALTPITSEDEGLVGDFIDAEDNTFTKNIDQGTGVMASQIHGDDPSVGSMPPVIGNELLMAADVLAKNDEPRMGMEFDSDAAARAFYNAYALCFGFGIRVARSRSERRKGVEVLVMKRFVCLKEGHHRKKKPVEPSNKKKRKRLSIRDGCPAMMEVVRRGPDRWVITKLVLEHTHVIVSADRARESLYEIRHKWVPAYLTSFFFAELSLTHRVETVNGLYASEAQKDITSFSPEQFLKTDMVLEKQARSIYTRAAFETFQLELVEAMQHYAVKVQDGSYMKYYVERNGDPPTRHTVFYNVAEKKAWCECCRFAFSAILCRHVLSVFLLAGVIMLPEPCITKRWTKKAKSGPELIGLNVGNGSSSPDSVASRYNDLVRDAIKCAEKGTVSAGAFRVAKEVLRKAFMDIRGHGEKLCKDALRSASSR
ncbi:FAR1-domain family sequence [Zea mays]|uniref:Protein FAR1-RELATED SEQUENCE n=1 Tax=Zea mays TaxID=4577 RepID=A0A1D6P2N9_MAIZE|nr:FAR1-domain family sequence [Zea mays]